MTKILIVDDHAIVRRGLMQILADRSDLIAVDEACSGADGINKACRGDYDLVLLDISMPGRGGLDVLKELKACRPKLPVLILSMHPEEQYAVRALRTGASGYLTKESATDELVTAIQKVLSGGKYVSASLAEKLAFAMGSDAETPLHATLSNREDQVFRMIASGMMPKAIAAEMALSAKTISTYRARILKKMKMMHNAELTHYAIKNQLTD